MIIQPYPQNTVINLYEGVGWDRSYSDVRWFRSYEERDSYLESHVKNKWLKCAVVNGNTIRLEGQQMDYVSCDYMTFFNPMQAGKQRVICCWITSIDYVNINTFSVTYEIDYIGTWFAEMIFEPCLVLQEHVNDDTPGIWPAEENLDLGDPQVMGVTKTMYSPAVIAAFLTPDQLSSVDFDGNIVTAIDYQCYKMTPATKILLKSLLDNRKEKPELVPFLSMGVEGFISGDGSQGKAIEFEREYTVPTSTLEFYRGGSGGSSYTAVNNKMRCYPYKFMTVDNYNGQVEQYKYEDFTDLNPKFKVVGVPYPTPILSMFPKDYKNYANGNYTQQSVVYDNFPRIGWLTAAFAVESWRYFSQPIMTLGSSLIRAGVTGNIASGALSGVNGITNLVSAYQNYKYDEKTLHSRQFKSSGASGSLNYAMGDIGFRVTQYQIKPEIAERIDRWFTRYGYPGLNTYKVPNIFGRQSVNYVKTADAHVRGRIPTQAKQAMEDALNRGISFWHTDPPAGRMEELYNPIVIQGGEDNG